MEKLTPVQPQNLNPGDFHFSYTAWLFRKNKMYNLNNKVLQTLTWLDIFIIHEIII